jgi:hypothetical protein
MVQNSIKMTNMDLKLIHCDITIISYITCMLRRRCYLKPKENQITKNNYLLQLVCWKPHHRNYYEVIFKITRSLTCNGSSNSCGVPNTNILHRSREFTIVPQILLKIDNWEFYKILSTQNSFV